MRQCKLSHADGNLVIASEGRDPHLGVKVNAAPGWKEFSFRARFAGRLEGQVFWATSKDEGFAESRSAKISVRSRGNEWQTHRVYFQNDAELTELRWDPSHRRGKIEVDWVALANRQPPGPQATPVADIKMLEDFKVELLYSVPGQSQGSWVSLTVDPQGRLITSDQYGKLYRVTVPSLDGDPKDIKIEPINVDLGMAQGLLCAFGSLYVMVNGPGAGLYRVRDTDGDDQYDDVKLLRAMKGGGEHGPHAIVLSPDGKSLYVCGGNHTDLPDPEESRVPRNWQEDQLLDRMWDAGGHAVGKLAPGGWICRTDPEGKTFELISIGFRNEYDIAFNGDGELFTYDADMEWDVGSPWYRPTRVCHATSGAEFGWRSGTGKWPVYYPDSLPPVVNIGPGSPTGVTFGRGSKFPAKYQRAMFILDWSYGVIYAVHLQPDGASYSAVAERFCGAAPLPVTDVVVNPHDGAMYFAIGGRRTQSGLYRVTYTGSESTAPASLANQEGAKLRALRKSLEAFHGMQSKQAVPTAWKHLGHDDRFIRYAARIAVEHQDVSTWRDKALQESNPLSLITAMVALARCGQPEDAPKMIQTLSQLDWSALDESLQLDLLRAYGLTFARIGPPSEQERAKVLDQVAASYPASSWPLNRELSQMLIYLEAPEVASKTLSLLAEAPTQEEQIHYALSLRKLDSGWTLDQRRQYFEWFNQAASHRGGHSFSGFLKNIRNEAIATLPKDVKAKLQPTLDAIKNTAPPEAELASRPLVKKWTVEDLLPVVQSDTGPRSLERGEKIFATAACFKCHRFKGQGGISGPDLTAVGRRFNSKNLLESLIEPSKVISDQYESTNFVMLDGRTITGKVVNLSGDTLRVITDMLNPGNLTTIRRDEIEEMYPSQTSLMPTGLLDTFTKEEILDLMHYLRSGGDEKPLVVGADD